MTIETAFANAQIDNATPENYAAMIELLRNIIDGALEEWSKEQI